MTDIYITDFELLRQSILYAQESGYGAFRDYDAEWQFIRQMDQLSDLRVPWHSVAVQEVVTFIGTDTLFLGFEPVNDNIQ